MAEYLAPELVTQLELDSEGGMFAAYGKRRALKRLQTTLEPYLADGDRVATLIRRLKAQGSSSTTDIEAREAWPARDGRRCGAAAGAAV